MSSTMHALSLAKENLGMFWDVTVTTFLVGRDPNLQLHFPLLFCCFPALGKLDGSWLMQLVGSRLFSNRQNSCRWPWMVCCRNLQNPSFSVGKIVINYCTKWDLSINLHFPFVFRVWGRNPKVGIDESWSPSHSFYHPLSHTRASQ